MHIPSGLRRQPTLQYDVVRRRQAACPRGRDQGAPSRARTNDLTPLHTSWRTEKTRRAMAKVVTILQHRLLHYRVQLFETLRRRLRERDIELRLIHGQASTTEKSRKDEGTLPWAERVQNRFLRLGPTELCWQSLPADVLRSDLLVLMQENKLLANYPLLVAGRARRIRTAYWGHGRNFMSTRPTGLRERWKEMWINRVDWWFAYTATTVDLLAEMGFPRDRITCLNNAIDTSGFAADLEASEARVSELRARYGLKPSSTVGLFCGSLYPEKRLDLLVEASDRLRSQLPDYRLLVVGDGPSAAFLENAFATRPWAHMVGVQRGVDKAAFYRVATVILNPGVIGLHVLDAFSAGRPMVTTETTQHGPEIAYLKNGVNGYVTPARVEEYVTAIVALATDASLYQRIADEGHLASRQYTLDHMVDNFVAGIEKCFQTS